MSEAERVRRRRLDWLDYVVAALAAEPTREQERVPSPGQLLIGTNGRGEVVIEHPDIDADKDGVGHIIFSTKEARALARTLLKKTDEAEQELRALATKEGSRQ